MTNYALPNVASYRNPFFIQDNPYSKQVLIGEYVETINNLFIYARWDKHGEVWDVVKGETLLTMRAGLNGAREFATNYKELQA